MSLVMDKSLFKGAFASEAGGWSFHGSLAWVIDGPTGGEFEFWDDKQPNYQGKGKQEERKPQINK
jgi:hypothetical protein